MQNREAIRHRIFTAFLSANPLCIICGVNAATAVKYKITIVDGGTNDWSNLIALCPHCYLMQ